MENITALRTFRDFLSQYNQISENCFLRCINHLSSRDLSLEEGQCVDMCTRKHVNVNHKVMQVYMEVQPLIVNKRIEEMNQQQAAIEEQNRKALEASQDTKAIDTSAETSPKQVENEVPEVAQSSVEVKS